jgi:CSLREA domain-containing protein
MQCHRLLSVLLPLLVLAACIEEQPPTSPTAPGAAGAELFQASGHKVVNSLADPGNGVCNATQCTLREAINDPQSTEISFASGVTGTITLARPSAGGGPLLIGKTLTITGPSGGIVIRRRSTDPAFRILRVDEGGSVTLANLGLRGGRTNDAGGPGIVNRGILALTDCSVSANVGEPGGGIDNFTLLTLLRSSVTNVGTGIVNHDDGTLRLRRSNVQHNFGTGILNTGGDLTLIRSTVADNSLTGVESRFGRVTLTESIVEDNKGGGISVESARLMISNSGIARNSSTFDGGGIRSAQSHVTIVGSTIVSNSAGGQGGGIFNNVSDPFGRLGSSVQLTNSTISRNAADSGGGVFNTSLLGNANIDLVNSTVTLNEARKAGGGLLGGESSREGDPNFLSLRNSLVAQNAAPTSPDVFAVQSERGDIGASFSLIGNGSGSSVSDGVNGNQVGTPSAPIDPRLGALTLNGGPTRTHALLAGSPAINAASSEFCPATDQRGVSRPQGAACDIGSYERQE